MSISHINSLMTAMDLDNYFEQIASQDHVTYSHNTLLNAWLSDNLKGNMDGGYQTTHAVCIGTGGTDPVAYLPTQYGAIRLLYRKSRSKSRRALEVSIYDSVYVKWTSHCLGVEHSRFAIKDIHSLRHIYLRSILSLSQPDIRDNMDNHHIVMLDGARFHYRYSDQAFTFMSDRVIKKGSTVDSVELDKHFKHQTITTGI